MNLRALFRRSPLRRTADSWTTVHRAAASAVEALEPRQLLSVSAAVYNRWHNMPASVWHNLAVLEYDYPDFVPGLTSFLASVDLPPLTPEAGTLVPDSAIAAAKSKNHHRPPARAHAKPHAHKPLHRPAVIAKDGPTPPQVSGTPSFSYQMRPNTLTVTFTEDVEPISGDTWLNTLSLVDLATGVSVAPTSAVYTSGNATVVYSFNSLPLPDGNLAAVLHGSAIEDKTNHLNLVGTDAVAGDDYVWTRSDSLYFYDGDFNGDRFANSADEQIILANFNTSVSSYSQGDANYDGVVNSADLQIFLNKFNTGVLKLGDPTALTANTSGGRGIQLSWTASSDPNVTAYDVYRDDQTNTITRIASGVSGTNFLDSSTVPGATYTYTVVGRDSSANDSSYPSNEVKATAPTVTASPVAPDLSFVDRATGSGGGDPPSIGYSGAVRYADGSVNITSTDLDPAESGLISGHTRTWTDEPGVAQGLTNGVDEVVSQWPSLVQEQSGSLMVVMGGQTTEWFDPNGSGGFRPRFYGQDSLSPDGNGGYNFLDSAGNLYDYFGFGTSIAALQRGQVNTLTDPAQNLTNFTYSTGGQLQTVVRSRHSDSAQLEKLTYLYFPSSQLESVEMDRLEGTTMTPVRTANYQYYDGSTAFGQFGELSLVTVTEGTSSGVPVNHMLYRYDPGSGLITYVVEGDSYEKLAANVSAPLTAPNATVAQYADYAFTYYGPSDGAKAYQVKTQALNGGQYVYSYDYPATTTSTDLNSWHYKTVETLPDSNGSTNTIYTNYAGEVILSVFKDGTTGNLFPTAYQYDSQGRVILSAEPSGVTQTLVSGEPTVLTDTTVTPNVTWYLNSTGLEHGTDYYASTTATETTAAGAAGYEEDTYLRQGYSSTGNIPQSSETYFAHAGANGVVYPVASDTVYAGTGGAGARTTNYSYGWRVNGTTTTDQALFQTVTYPLVTHNGSGSAESKQTYFDPFGRVQWTKDGSGYIQYTGYDDPTGAVVETIDDVDYSKLTTEQGTFPSAWAHVTGGLHLITSMMVDGLGRTTKVTDPNGQATTTQYIDSAAVQEVITTPPTVSSPGLTPPTLVTRDDRANGDVYTLTVAAGTTTVESMSRSHYDASGQLAWSERFPSTSGMTYTLPVNGQPGTLSIGTVQGYATLYGYDSLGRQDRVDGDVALSTNPSGSTPPGINTPQITRTVYDSLGRVSSTWTGTNDTPASGIWSPTNNTSPANMVEVSANVYDGGGVGDGNLTQTTQFTGVAGEPNRVTETDYDFRDRAIISESGVGATHPPITYTIYDNLDEPTDVQTYDGGGISFSNISATSLTTTYASDLRAYTQKAYDERGRVYQTLTHDIGQPDGIHTIGGVSNPDTPGTDYGSLVTNTFYDPRGNAVAVFAPGGLVTKSVYDGAGRLIKQFTTDGGATGNVSGGHLPLLDYADAMSVSNDVVLEQTYTQYDGDGDPIFVVNFQRHHDSTDLGALQYGLFNYSSGTYTHARISFVSNVYDEADRLLFSIDWGNHGDDGGSLVNASAPTGFNIPPVQSRDSTAISGFDQWLRTDYQYDAAGRRAIVIDARGIGTRTFYDSLGRTIGVTEAYTGSLSNNDPSLPIPGSDESPGEAPGDTDRQTQYQYNGADEVTQQTSITYNPSAPSTPNSEATTYSYGVTTAAGYALNSNTLLNTTTYQLVADPSGSNEPPITGLSSDTQQVTGYDVLGDVTQQIDRDGTTHAFMYDPLGRQIDDHAIAYASFSTNLISKWADEKQTTYDALGQPVEMTMLGGGTAKNDIYNVYDGLGNLIKQYQPHDGRALSGGTLRSGIPVVQYTYDTNFTNNYSRQTQIIYPTDGRVISYSYSFDTSPYGGTPTGDFLASLNSAISRIGYVFDGATPSGAAELETYDYLGLNTVVTRDHINGPTALSYISNPYESSLFADPYGTTSTTVNGPPLAVDPSNQSYLPRDDAGSQDPYDGLDRFGRVVDQSWDPQTERQLAYDADGNLLYSLMLSPDKDQSWMSEVFHGPGATAANAYDDLNRIRAYYRGWMNAGSGTSSNPYDSSVTQGSIVIDPSTGDTVPVQYESVDSFMPNSQTGDYNQKLGTTPDLPNGNVFQEPVPSSSTTYPSLGNEDLLNERDMFLQFDPFGELASQSQAYLASNGSGAYSFVGAYQNAYQFDALGRRISETTTTRKGDVTTTDLFYDASGNVIQDSNPPSGGVVNVVNQYIWCPVESNMMILRDSKQSGETNVWGVAASGLNLRMYVSQGPDGSVWEISGANTSSPAFFTEQYVYDPSGQVTVVDWATDHYGLFSITSTFDFRYMWKGGRTGRDQINKDNPPNPADDPNYIDTYDGTYLLPSGAVYDTHVTNAAPLLSDKYAFFRTTTSNGGLDQYQYGVRSNVNATFGSNGTASNTQDLQLALAAIQIQSGFEEALTFGGSFAGNVASEIGGGIEELGLRVADFVNTGVYAATTWASGGRYSVGYNGSFSQLGQAIDTRQTTRWRATLSTIPIAGSAYQAYTGRDLLSGRMLSESDRAALAFAAVSDAAFLGAAEGLGNAASRGVALSRIDEALSAGDVEPVFRDAAREFIPQSRAYGLVTDTQGNLVPAVEASGFRALYRDTIIKLAAEDMGFDPRQIRYVEEIGSGHMGGVYQDAQILIDHWAFDQEFLATEGLQSWREVIAHEIGHHLHEIMDWQARDALFAQIDNAEYWAPRLASEKLPGLTPGERATLLAHAEANR